MTGHVMMAICSSFSTLVLISFGSFINFKTNVLKATIRKCINNSNSNTMQSYLRDLVEEIGSKAIQIKMTIFPIDCKITFDVRRINFFFKPTLFNYSIFVEGFIAFFYSAIHINTI